MNYGNMNNGLADRLHDILDTKLETNYGVVICGGMLKMGMSIEQIMECFLAVCYANLAKGNKIVNGKITKDDSFEAIDPKHVIRKVLLEIEQNEEK